MTPPSGRIGPFWLLSAQNRLFKGARGGPQQFFFIRIFIFLWLRSPCKKSKSYDTPLCHFSNGGTNNKNKKSGKIPKIVAYGAFDETVRTAPLGPKFEQNVLPCFDGSSFIEHFNSGALLLGSGRQAAGVTAMTGPEFWLGLDSMWWPLIGPPILKARVAHEIVASLAVASAASTLAPREV